MSGSSRSRGWPGILASALLFLSGSAWAADESWTQPLPDFGAVGSAGVSLSRQDLRLDRFEPSAPARRAAIPATNRFFRGHFVPRLAHQFEEVMPIAPAQAETDFSDSLRFTTVSEIARSRVERGTIKAVKYYLLEVSSLDRTYDAIKLRGKKTPGGGRTEGLRVGVRISGGLPQLEMRRQMASGTLRFRADPSGSLGLEFKQIRHRYSRVFVGYDLDDSQYSLGCRLSF